MAAVGVTVLNSRTKSDVKIATGTGAPSLTNDATALLPDGVTLDPQTSNIVTNVSYWPVGSMYFDLGSNIQYVRVAAAGVLADWVYSAAYTAL